MHGAEKQMAFAPLHPSREAGIVSFLIAKFFGGALVITFPVLTLWLIRLGQRAICEPDD
jgi:hypothetical protein